LSIDESPRLPLPLLLVLVLVLLLLLLLLRWLLLRLCTPIIQVCSFELKQPVNCNVACHPVPCTHPLNRTCPAPPRSGGRKNPHATR
jgi:hypothetical protein